MPQREQLLLAHVLGLWVCVWTAEHLVLLVGSPHLHETAVNSPKALALTSWVLFLFAFSIAGQALWRHLSTALFLLHESGVLA